MKGYRLYDMAAKHFFVSRDVVFYENTFPFHSIVSSHDLVDPFPDLVIPYSQHQSISSPVDYVLTKGCVADSVLISPYNPLSPRRSTRVLRPPSYLQDFHCNLLS